MKTLITFLIILVGLAACEKREKSATPREPIVEHVVCYSGGVEIYNGRTLGITYVHESHVSFRNAQSHTWVRIVADCLITYVSGNK